MDAPWLVLGVVALIVWLPIAVTLTWVLDHLTGKNRTQMVTLIRAFMMISILVILMLLAVSLGRVVFYEMLP